MQALTLPSSPGRSGWRFSPSAVLAAINEFGITDPVVVKLANGRRRHGSHRSKLAGNQRLVWRMEGTRLVPILPAGAKWVHSITISTYLTANEAGRCLWHELTHAKQSEEIGHATFHYSDDPARSVYALETRRHGRGYRAYLANRFEVEARGNESKSDTKPLVAGLPVKQAICPDPDLADLMHQIQLASPRPATPPTAPKPIVTIVGGSREAFVQKDKELTRELGRLEKKRREMGYPVEVTQRIEALRAQRKIVRENL